MKQTLLLLSAAVLAAALCACPEPAAEDPAAPVWNYPPASLEEAQQRIEYYRMDDIEFVVTKDGQAVAGADVKVEMLNHEFLFGGGFLNFNRSDAYGPDSNFARYFVELFNYATLWHQWKEDEFRRGEPFYNNLEAVAAFCAENGIKTKTGALMSHSDGPGWLDSAVLNDEQRLELALRHITRDVGTLKGKIDIFDVFNEAGNYDSTTANKRLHETAGGVEQLAVESFRAAKAGNNPNARFIINEYQYSAQYHDVIQAVIDAGCQLDAVGVQTHMHAGWWEGDRAWNLAQTLSQFGKPVHFTELTILSRMTGTPGGSASTTEGEEGQKEVAIRTYYTWFSHPAVEAISWWDFCDAASWYNEPAGLIRADQTPKPAYHALKELIWETWATNETVTTGADGKARLRAYRGEYRFTVTLPDGTTREFTGTVKKGGGAVPLEI